MNAAIQIGAVGVLAIAGLYLLVGSAYHARRKRRWKKRVQLYHEEQARKAAADDPKPGLELSQESS